MFRRDMRDYRDYRPKKQPEPMEEDPGKWWENPSNLALLIRCQWLYGNVETVEDVLTIIEHPEFWGDEFIRIIEALDAA